MDSDKSSPYVPNGNDTYEDDMPSQQSRRPLRRSPQQNQSLIYESWLSLGYPQNLPFYVKNQWSTTASPGNCPSWGSAEPNEIWDDQQSEMPEQHPEPFDLSMRGQDMSPYFSTLQLIGSGSTRAANFHPGFGIEYSAQSNSQQGLICDDAQKSPRRVIIPADEGSLLHHSLPKPLHTQPPPSTNYLYYRRINHNSLKMVSVGTQTSNLCGCHQNSDIERIQVNQDRNMICPSTSKSSNSVREVQDQTSYNFSRGPTQHGSQGPRHHFYNSPPPTSRPCHEDNTAQTPVRPSVNPYPRWDRKTPYPQNFQAEGANNRPSMVELASTQISSKSTTEEYTFSATVQTDGSVSLSIRDRNEVLSEPTSPLMILPETGSSLIRLPVPPNIKLTDDLAGSNDATVKFSGLKDHLYCLSDSVDGWQRTWEGDSSTDSFTELGANSSTDTATESGIDA